MLLIFQNTVYKTSESAPLGGCDAVFYERGAQEVRFFLGGGSVGGIRSVDVDEWNALQKQLVSSHSSQFPHSTPWSVFSPAAIDSVVGPSATLGYQDVEVNFDVGIYTI